MAYEVRQLPHPALAPRPPRAYQTPIPTYTHFRSITISKNLLLLGTFSSKNTILPSRVLNLITTVFFGIISYTPKYRSTFVQNKQTDEILFPLDVVVATSCGRRRSAPNARAAGAPRDRAPLSFQNIERTAFSLRRGYSLRAPSKQAVRALNCELNNNDVV